MNLELLQTPKWITVDNAEECIHRIFHPERALPVSVVVKCPTVNILNNFGRQHQDSPLLAQMEIRGIILLQRAWVLLSTLSFINQAAQPAEGMHFPVSIIATILNNNIKVMNLVVEAL